MPIKVNEAVISNRFIRRPYIVVIAASLILTACFSRCRDTIDEFPKDSVTINYILKDKRPAEIKYEKLVRQFTPYVLLSGIAQASTTVTRYTVITVTLKEAFGRDKVYRWIDVLPANPGATYYIKVNRLALTEHDAFLEYTCIPNFPADHPVYADTKSKPFDGNPRLVVKYARYRGTVSAKADRNNQYPEIYPDTYKWRDRYIWDEVLKEDFDRAVEAGDQIVLAGIGSNGKNDFEHNHTLFAAYRVYYGSRKGYAIDFYDYYSKRIAKDSEQNSFLSAVRAGDGVKVEDLLARNPKLIESHDPDGLTPLHLVLLSRRRHHLFPLLIKSHPRVNDIDYQGRTPLELALSSGADKAIINELTRMGGKRLSADCSAFLDALEKKIENRSNKGRKQSADTSSWVGDDVYQVWVEFDRSRLGEYGENDQRTVLDEGRDRIIRELGLSGTGEPEQSKRIELILDNTHATCSRLDEKTRSVTHILVRICAPNLRKLVDQ